MSEHMANPDNLGKAYLKIKSKNRADPLPRIPSEGLWVWPSETAFY